MRPLKQFQSTLHFLRAIYKWIGQDVFTDQFRHSHIFYVVFFLFFTPILFYTLDLLFTNDLDGSIRLTQACTLFGLIQILTKYYLLKNLQTLRPIVAVFEDIYRKNSQPTDEYFEVCCRYARFTEMMLKIAAANYAGLTAFITVSGLIESALTMKPAYCFYFPFIHEYSVGQLVMLNAFIGTTGLVTVLVIPAGDLFIYVVVANLTMIPLIISVQLDDLSTRLRQHQANVKDIRRRWMHYIVIHQEYVR